MIYKVTCTIALLAPLLAAGQSVPNAAELIRQLSATYSAATEYELVLEYFDGNAKMRVHAAARGSAGFRLEETRLDLDPPVVAFRTVWDANTTWTYRGEKGTYTITPRRAGFEKGLETLFFDSLEPFRSGAKYADDAELLREDFTQVGQIKVDCYVVRIQPYEFRQDTWWISKQSLLVVRVDRPGQSSNVFTTIKLNQRVPDELFHFDPPAGARQVDTRP